MPLLPLGFLVRTKAQYKIKIIYMEYLISISMFTDHSGHSLQTYCAKKYLRENLYFVNFQRHITAANLETDQTEMY